MRSRIESHNVLNGIKFSIAEFVLIAAVLLPFAVYYIIHAQFDLATICLGIILNCAAIIALGLRQLSQHVPDIGLRQLLNKQVREKIARENPNLSQDTALITLTTLVPYLLLGLVLYDIFRHGNG